MNNITKYSPATPVTELSGVGRARAASLASLGIYTLRDLIYHLPRAYQNRGDVATLGGFDTERERAYVLTVATSVSSAKIKRGMTISKFRAFDESGSCEIVFFNAPFVKEVFHVGATFRFFGRCSFNKMRRLSMSNPKYEPIIPGVPLDDFVPIYPLTAGISTKILEKLIRTALECALPLLDDPLPEGIRLDNRLPSLSLALRDIHFPSDDEALARAQRRLAFDELLRFGLAVSITASGRKRGRGVKFSPVDFTPITSTLGFELTKSQRDAVNDIYRDTVLSTDEDGRTPAMARILVGDVGCGKTVCAELAMYLAVKSGYQAALMVPTEILAKQHFDEIYSRFTALGMKVALLTGSTRASEKKLIYEGAESGEIDIIVGTHALLSDKLEFAKLGLIITDEQHRFGVSQRAHLKDKAENAHMLVMSATPIPRTLALALYGDLDITRITDMPRGRMRVDTFVVDSGYRERINSFIKKQVVEGGQCYIVCPAIEGDEEDDGGLEGAIEYADRLRTLLPDISIATLHGKMRTAEKDAVMLDFALGKSQVLVSTTVIEVGVNVPNASLMIVECAERFGLSQLHQLRGRVGRGKRKSYCILVSDNKSEKSMARLNVMRTTYDGYEIADKDLALRGPGDFFSSNGGDNLRQSGGFAFNAAAMITDPELPERAFSAAREIILRDPALALPEHAALRREALAIAAPSSTIS
ncbi:MAG: ATP-dependent DNA helicase RecG [Clostridia bacterium]|nr:ATP-dependent DNA helicase RecG [Clostridia bacterium]